MKMINELKIEIIKTFDMTILCLDLLICQHISEQIK